MKNIIIGLAIVLSNTIQAQLDFKIITTNKDTTITLGRVVEDQDTTYTIFFAMEKESLIMMPRLHLKRSELSSLHNWMLLLIEAKYEVLVPADGEYKLLRKKGLYVIQVKDKEWKMTKEEVQRFLKDLDIELKPSNKKPWLLTRVFSY